MSTKKRSKKAKKRSKVKKHSRPPFEIPADCIEVNERGSPARAESQRELASSFNSLCMRIAKHERRVSVTDHKVLQLFDAIGVFARKHKLDPATWVYSVFAQAGFKRCPSWENFFNLKRTRNVKNLFPRDYTLIATRKITEGAKRANGFVPFRDLSIGAESAKRQYLERSRADLCMLAVDLTFGFHPESTHCASCPSRDPCSTKTAALAKDLHDKRTTT